MASFLWHINLCIKAILVEEQEWYYLTRSSMIWELISFPGVLVKEKKHVLMRLESELTYLEVLIQRFYRYATGTFRV